MIPEKMLLEKMIMIADYDFRLEEYIRYQEMFNDWIKKGLITRFTIEIEDTYLMIRLYGIDRELRFETELLESLP